KKNYINVANKLLNDSRLNRYFTTNILVYAMEKKHTDIVKLILSNDKFSRDAKNELLFKTASQFGSVEIIENLLQHGADPSIENNYPISIAVEKGFTDLVRLLLNDTRVNPDVLNNIGKAAELGYTEIVEMLLKNEKVNPAAENNYAIRWS